jgi:hypothetical protein
MALAIICGIASFSGIVLGGMQLNSEVDVGYGQSQAAGIGGLVSSIIMTFANVLLLVGCIKNQKHFFIPWMILKMIGIVAAYLIVLILLGSGILALVLTEQQVRDHLFVDTNRFEVYDGNKFAVIGDLAGVSALLAAAIILVVTSVMTYLWAVVQHLYKKMGIQSNDHTLLIEEPDFVKQTYEKK